MSKKTKGRIRPVFDGEGRIRRGASRGCLLREASLPTLHGFCSQKLDADDREVIDKEIERRKGVVSDAKREQRGTTRKKKRTKNGALRESSVMPFGKFRGYKVLDILLDQPDYILWVQSNLDTGGEMFRQSVIDSAYEIIAMDMGYVESLQQIHEWLKEPKIEHAMKIIEMNSKKCLPLAMDDSLDELEGDDEQDTIEP